MYQICLALLVLLIGAGSADAACRPVEVPGAGAALPALGGQLNQPLLDRAVRAWVNAERCRAGLAPLASAAHLRKVAEIHSRWMAATGRFSQAGGPPGQGALMARARSTGIEFQVAAENIALYHLYPLEGPAFRLGSGHCDFLTRAGQKIARRSYGQLARDAMAGWMASPGHRANILNPELRLIGTAAAIGPGDGYCGQVYLTQEFAG
ncbi:CAP domain-containing protein [Thioclava sp. BHET1]|nr:CAP domain-containing protein [Thioclava sp. BHET1]